MNWIITIYYILYVQNEIVSHCIEEPFNNPSTTSDIIPEISSPDYKKLYKELSQEHHNIKLK